MAKDIIEIEFKPVGDGVLIDAIAKLDKATKKLIQAQASLAKTGKKQINSNKAHENSVKRLEIKLKALGFTFTQAGISTRMQKEAFKGNRLELEKMRIATKKFIATQKQADVSTRILGGSLAVLRSKLLIYNFAMALGIRQTLKFAETGAKVDSMSTAFNTLSGATEDSEEALLKLTEATDGTMSEFDLFQQANNAMILGVSKNSDEMAEMFDIAQRLGRALGRDTASSVESLITGIGRQSRLMLDNIGIIVKADEAYESYAKKIGTTADKLSDADKKQAFLNATMESARKKVATLGSEIPSTQDALDKLSASFSNLQSAIGQNVPLFDSALEFITKYADKATKAIKGQEILTKAENRLNIALATKERLEKSINFHIKNGAEVTSELITSLKSELKIQDDVIKKIIGGTNSYFDNAKAKKEQIELNKKKQESDELDARNEKAKAEQIKQSFIKQAEMQTARNQQLEDARKKQEKSHQETIKQKKDELEQTKKEAEAKAEAHRLNFEAIKEIENAKRTLYENNLHFQLMSIDLQADKFREMKLNEADIVKFVEESKRDAVISNLEETSALYRGASATYDQFIQSLVDLEMTGKDRREKIWSATRSSFIVFLGELVKDKIKQLIAEKLITTSAQATSIASAKATGLAIAQAYAVPASLASTASFGGASVAGQAGITASILATKALATFEDGGLVGGRRHSQGGTIIEAERGEFVMSRSAVQSIGVETLNQMNQGGGGGITLNISAPLVDETIVDTIIPAIQKAQRMNLA